MQVRCRSANAARHGTTRSPRQDARSDPDRPPGAGPCEKAAITSMAPRRGPSCDNATSGKKSFVLSRIPTRHLAQRTLAAYGEPRASPATNAAVVASVVDSSGVLKSSHRSFFTRHPVAHGAAALEDAQSARREALGTARIRGRASACSNLQHSTSACWLACKIRRRIRRGPLRTSHSMHA